MKKREWEVVIKMNRFHVLKVEVRAYGGMKVEAVNIPVTHGQMFTIPVHTSDGVKCVNFCVEVS